MPSHASLPGFRDFYPPELAVRAHIVAAWRAASRRFGFEEYDGPPLEPLELYTEKSGPEIVQQLYNFADKGGRAVALRPEMTPTFARMVGARAGALRKPVRWFCIPQLFRYERTQRGRLREHFQWNADIVGEPGVGADAEIAALALDALRGLGLGEADIVLRYSDRRLLERLLRAHGVPEQGLPAAYAAVDKLGRESVELVRARLVEAAGIGAGAADTLLDALQRAQLDDVMREVGSAPGVSEAAERLQAYAAQLDDLGCGGYAQFDATIVRGLAYYTGVVFEIFDRGRKLRAICGGGRYDDLLGQLSGVALPAVGFGMGDVVLGELLRERGLLPDVRARLDYYVVAVGVAEQPLQRRLAAALRAHGYTAGYALGGGSVSRQFKDAAARGAAHVVVIGPDEAAAGVAVVRDMDSGAERRLPLATWLGGGDTGRSSA